MIRQNWKEINGDETLALDWPLYSTSHVWEIGGYEGRWAKQILEKYDCDITIFEPQLWAVQRMQITFRENWNIHLKPYGLWTENVVLPIGNYGTDGASLINDDGREVKQLGAFRSISQEMKEVESYIDLALMNIEGAEYTLIPRMIEHNHMARFKNFWCQFHPKVADDPAFVHIVEGMAKTHEMIWDCYPHAVAWRRK